MWNYVCGLIWYGDKWAAFPSMSKNDLSVYTLGMWEIYKKLAAYKVFSSLLIYIIMFVNLYKIDILI